jgi:hypothetical protein
MLTTSAGQADCDFSGSFTPAASHISTLSREESSGVYSWWVPTCQIRSCPSPQYACARPWIVKHVSATCGGRVSAAVLEMGTKPIANREHAMRMRSFIPQPLTLFSNRYQSLPGRHSLVKGKCLDIPAPQHITLRANEPKAKEWRHYSLMMYRHLGLSEPILLFRKP